MAEDSTSVLIILIYDLLNIYDNFTFTHFVKLGCLGAFLVCS